MAKHVSEWHPCTWPQQGRQQTKVLVVETKVGEPEAPWWTPVGYIWLSPVAAYDKGTIIELPLCAKPGWEGSWLTPRVLRQSLKAMQETGARYVIALHPDPKYRDLLKRLGWGTCGDFVNVLDLENHNGILKRNLRRGR